jgi:hypothetical protein
MKIDFKQKRPPRHLDPIKNPGKRIGRNEPCPCKSGKKFKHCHMPTLERKPLEKDLKDDSADE